MTADELLDIELSHIRNCSLREMQANIAVAAKYGMATVAYEGGQHLVGLNGAENHGALTAVFKSANRHPRMKALYDEYLQNWKAAGGDLFVNYSDLSAYTKHGSWGALESMTQDPTTAPKYQSLMSYSLDNP